MARCRGVVGQDLWFPVGARLVAEGGQSLVFELPGRPGIVVKVDKGCIRSVMARRRLNALGAGASLAADRTQLADEMQSDQARFRRLRKHFGRAHVPRQKRFLADITSTGMFWPTHCVNSSRFREAEPAGSLFAIITVQRRVKDLHYPHVSLVLSLAEASPWISDSLYERVTDDLVFASAQCESTEIERFLRGSCPMLGPLLARVKSDRSFREVLGALLEEIVAFSTETGEMLDLIGPGNVVFFERGRAWSYALNTL